MKEGMLSHEDKAYDERVVLNRAYNKVKTAHEIGKRRYYENVLKDELTYFSAFMQRWFELAKVDPKTSVGLKHEKEYERFRSIYHSLYYEYEVKYRWRNLRTLLQLIINQDNTMFQKELGNRSFNYLFVKYGVLKYDLINKILNNANISESDIVDKDRIKTLINVCNELEKEDSERNKAQIMLRENILNPFGQLEN